MGVGGAKTIPAFGFRGTSSSRWPFEIFRCTIAISFDSNSRSLYALGSCPQVVKIFDNSKEPELRASSTLSSGCLNTETGKTPKSRTCWRINIVR